MTCKIFSIRSLLFSLFSSLLILFSFISSDASASSQGVFWSNSFSAQRYLSGNSSPLNISGAFTPVYNKDFSSWIGFPNDFSNYSDLCFNFPGLSIDSDSVNYTLSVSYTVQNGRVFSLNSTPETSNSPLNQVTSSSFGDSLNNLFDVGTDITNYNSEYTATMSVSGILSKSSGTSSRVCFGGLFGQGVKKSVGDGITIHQPFISVYKSESSKIDSSVNDVNDTLKDQAQKEEDAANQNQEDLSSGSNSSQNDANQATESLFSVITGFISAITSTSPSNCNIDMNLGFFDGGSTNLCTGGSNPIVSVVGSIMLIGLCVPLCWCAVSKMVGLFRSFQT